MALRRCGRSDELVFVIWCSICHPSARSMMETKAWLISLGLQLRRNRKPNAVGNIHGDCREPGQEASTCKRKACRAASRRCTFPTKRRNSACFFSSCFTTATTTTTTTARSKCVRGVRSGQRPGDGLIRSCLKGQEHICFLIRRISPSRRARPRTPWGLSNTICREC